MEGDFPVKWKWVSESTTDFLAAVEPQPLWTGSLPVCLVEYHQGFSRRLRLILTLQTHLTKGERALLDEQHPVHGKIHHSGLLFGYAADRSTEPDWYVLPDGHQPKAWKLLHAARNGGDRFCVGSGPRYAAGQAGDAANKAKGYQFESLHTIYFYDAWRWKIELNQPGSPLCLPPRPGLLQNGCYGQPTPERVDSAACTQNTQESAACAEVSLTETSSAESEETSPPSEIPEPASQGQATESPTSPIMIGSTEEEQVGSETNAAEASEEPSAAASPIETVASASDNDAAQAKRTAPTMTSPAATSAAKAAERRDLTEGAQAGETESSTTDEILDLEASTEAFQTHTASSSNDPNTMMASQTAPHDQPPPRPLPAGRETAVIKEADETKPPVSPVPPGCTEGRRDTSVRARTTGKAQLEGNSGHPCDCPSVPPAKASSTNLPLGEEKRRNRWATSSPTVSVAPPQGVDPAARSDDSPASPTSPAHPGSKGAVEAPAPQATARPTPQGPLAVKSKAAKPAAVSQERAPEQGLLDALQSRLHTPPTPATGLLSIAAARPPTTGAANPQMPAATTEDPGTRTSTKEEVATQEIYLQEADDQSGPVDADITQLAEESSMHMVFRYQMLSIERIAQASPHTAELPTTLPPVPPVSLYADLPQEWPLARLSVQLRHIGVLLRVTLFRRAAELNFRGVPFRHIPREVLKSICHDFNHIGGELARRLASLFAFLKPASGTDTHADRLGLSLYAEPAYWLYGLLSFCAKACESKIEEAQGAPVLRAKDDGGTPDIEATGRTLALMQTVVMSFGRNQSLRQTGPSYTPPARLLPSPASAQTGGKNENRPKVH